MPSVTHTLAAQFAIETKRRKGDRLLRRSRVMSLIAILLLISASFIADPIIRRSVGLPMLGILLALKGFVSYGDWKSKTAMLHDPNAS